MNAYNFGPASDEETTVFGAQRPGYPSQQVTAAQVVDWIDFMRTNDIHRVCCLLTNVQMSHYGDLPGMYRTVVHCSAGSGRTGHVLAAWLVYRHGLTENEALRAVTHVADVQRNPFEAVDREATHEALYALLPRRTANTVFARNSSTATILSNPPHFCIAPICARSPTTRKINDPCSNTRCL